MPQPANKKRKTTDTESAIKDPRFSNIQSDPRYRLPGKNEKVKLDKRFARALQDDDFSRKAKVDRYGRPISNEAEKQRLKRRFDFEDSAEESDEPDDDLEVQNELKRLSGNRDFLREGKDVSSSDEETSSDDDSEVDEEVDQDLMPGVAQNDLMMGEASSRLAVVNLDWDNIRAEDLMAVFSSFIPPSGRLLKVAVYPSEFGKERIEREEMEGPPKEIFATNKLKDDASDSDMDDDDDIKADMIKPDDGADFDSTALRQYQLDRLRYFYAVLSFSSVETAKAIYDAVDGTEYLSTANFFDLRFVPDDVDFTYDRPREECEKIPPGYKPNEFITDALQHSKVKLTWDMDDGTRKEAQARAFRGSRREIDENDLKAYLGSSSESSDGEDNIGDDKINGASNVGTSKKDAERQRMRALLGLAPEPVTKDKKEKQGPTGNIQITFSSGLGGPADYSGSDTDTATTKKSKSKRSVFANSPEPEETTVEKYVRKEKERKQRRKEKSKATRLGGDEIEDGSASGKEDDLGFDDPFFAEPSHDAKSANKLRKEERLKKKQEREADEAASAQRRAELEQLMADDQDGDDPSAKGRTVKHFDMNDIEKAEKAAKKKSKKSKKSARADEATETVTDNFQINTADPRFAGLYENHEYAIDPTNSRFKETKGMKALLEESRNRKVKKMKHTLKDDGQHRAKSKKMAANESTTALVDKIKKKHKST